MASDGTLDVMTGMDSDNGLTSARLSELLAPSVTLDRLRD